MLPISSVASSCFQYQCAYIKCVPKIGNWQHSHGQHLQRFQRVRIKEERHNTNKGDTVVVMPRFFVDITCNYHFSKVVVYVAKGKCFLGTFFVIRNCVRRLDVDPFVCFVDDKVYFILSHFVFAGCACFELNNSNIYRISATNQLVIYDIFSVYKCLDSSKNLKVFLLYHIFSRRQIRCSGCL